MYIIGITGSIGSGKSTISRMLAEMAGIMLVDADSIAREIVQPGKEALKSIVEVFGKDMLLKDGNLNRPKLGELVFNNPAARKKLNYITFPIIRARLVDSLGAYLLGGEEYVIYDAPLLFESGTDDLVHYTVVVYTSRDIQIERIKNRNNLTEEQAIARIESQTPTEELLKCQTNYLIYNAEALDTLQDTVKILWRDIQAKRNR